MFSEDLQAWFYNFSQSAAVDMGEGGDDKECVAEMCVTCLSSYDQALWDEYRAVVEKSGHAAALAEVARHVCTL